MRRFCVCYGYRHAVHLSEEIMTQRPSTVTALIAIGVASTLGISSPASNAQAPAANQTHAQQLMQAADTNHDGKLSSAEASQFVSSRFDQLNTSHNGKLTEQEFEAPAKAKMAQASPSDKAGYQQALTQMPAEFKAMDADRDGTVSKEEYIAAVQKQLAKAAGIESATQGSSGTSAPRSGTSAPPSGTGTAGLSAEQLGAPAGAVFMIIVEPLVDAGGSQ
jgi:EF hand domain-containing protein